VTVREQVAHAIAQRDAHKRERELVLASLMACPRVITTSNGDDRRDRER
jgi:hypothetical protein